MSKKETGIKQLAKAGGDVKQVAGDNKETIISTIAFLRFMEVRFAVPYGLNFFI